MPYISQDKRIGRLYDALWNVPTQLSSGELNYLITKIFLRQHPSNYSEYNALIGVLECVKLEFYRRSVALYEEKKMKENGDVY